MKIITHLKTKAKALKKEITVLYYAYRHPNMPLLPKIIIFITIGYALSPIDLIPDFIPVIGYLDDLIIVPLLISLSIRMIPAYIIDESRIKANSEPIVLNKNWFFGILFIAIWISIILIVISITFVKCSQTGL